MRLLPALSFVSLIAVAVVARAQALDAAPPSDDRVMIFFAWDRPVIDGDGAARLDAFAAAFARSPNNRLEVSGHADRSGPAAANVQSARRRAEAVAAYLTQRGVPETAMTIVSHGETRPLIPTADGVREPQNRRVDIVTR